MKNQELELKNYELAQPEQMVAMANVLKNHIVKNALYTTIGSRNYAHVEGWQFAGGMLGIFPRVAKVENLSSDKETKWFAEVELVDLRSKEVISRGFAVCSNLEGKKKTFDEYAVLSMAQTRAIGKGFRNIVGWVMKLAGYESTPSEEMVEGMVGKAMASKDVDTKNYEMQVKATRNTDELKTIWLSFPPDIRNITSLKKLKDELKEKFIEAGL
jgi:hypothetical protein